MSSVQTVSTRSQLRPKVPSANQITMTGVRYNPPPLDLLKPPVYETGDYGEEEQRKAKGLEKALNAFNIPVVAFVIPYPTHKFVSRI